MGRKEDRIWQEGFEAACRIAEKDGLEGLALERRFRGVTGLRSRLTSQELYEQSEDIKKVMYATTEITFISVLHDEFGFGKQRLERLIKGIIKFDAYLEHGWAYMVDYINSIDKELGISLLANKMVDEVPFWQRPDPEDIYTEVDLIEKDAWIARLNFLGLTDDGEGRVQSKDGGWCWKYNNEYDKVQIYDELYGIVLAVNALGAKRPGEEGHLVEDAGNCPQGQEKRPQGQENAHRKDDHGNKTGNRCGVKKRRSHRKNK